MPAQKKSTTERYHSIERSILRMLQADSPGHTLTNTRSDMLFRTEHPINITWLVNLAVSHANHQRWLRDTTKAARAVLKPDDKISATMCGGAHRHFTFTHWESDSVCGKTVGDCHAASIYKVNGKQVDFTPMSLA